MLGIPYQRHSDTSLEAAVEAKPIAATLRMKVYAAIEASSCGLTDLELQELLDMPGSTQRPRRVELLQRGQIKAAGRRQTPSGRYATVWVVTPEEAARPLVGTQQELEYGKINT